jgi:hypothetical protein
MCNTLQEASVAPCGAIGWPIFVFGLLFYTLGRAQGIILKWGSSDFFPEYQ